MAVGIVLAVFGLGACARGAEAEARQLAELRELLHRTQAQLDQFDQRLGLLEVRVEDRTALTDGQPDRSPARSTASENAHDDEPSTTAQGATSDSVSRGGETEKQFAEALSLFRANRFERALRAFGRFVIQWPDDPRADWATYYRGECYLSLGRDSKAKDNFEGVLARDAGSELTAKTRRRLAEIDRRSSRLATVRSRMPVSHVSNRSVPRAGS